MSLSAGVRNVCLFTLVFGMFAPCALAAFAQCQTGWDWATNSKEQNPCEVAGALEAQCRGYSVYELGPLEQDTNYVTPQKNSTTQNCQCNTVMYSLYQLCTACQNVTTQSWSFWSQFCTQVYVTQYPEDIPAGTAVPHWAFLNWTTPNKFDSATAKSAGGQPEVLTPAPSTVSLSSTSTGSSLVLPSMSAMPTSTSTSQYNNNTKKSSNVGAIVGSVIGGLVILAVTGAGVLLLLRRRPVIRIEEDFDHPKYSTSSMSGHRATPSQMRLYDPSDPSTYPSLGDYDNTITHTTPLNNGRYSGAAEL